MENIQHEHATKKNNRDYLSKLPPEILAHHLLPYLLPYTAAIDQYKNCIVQKAFGTLRINYFIVLQLCDESKSIAPLLCSNKNLHKILNEWMRVKLNKYAHCIAASPLLIYKSPSLKKELQSSFYDCIYKKFLEKATINFCSLFFEIMSIQSQ